MIAQIFKIIYQACIPCLGCITVADLILSLSLLKLTACTSKNFSLITLNMASRLSVVTNVDSFSLLCSSWILEIMFYIGVGKVKEHFKKFSRRIPIHCCRTTAWQVSRSVSNCINPVPVQWGKVDKTDSTFSISVLFYKWKIIHFRNMLHRNHKVLLNMHWWQCNTPPPPPTKIVGQGITIYRPRSEGYVFTGICLSNFEGRQTPSSPGR